MINFWILGWLFAQDFFVHGTNLVTDKDEFGLAFSLDFSIFRNNFSIFSPGTSATSRKSSVLYVKTSN